MIKSHELEATPQQSTEPNIILFMSGALGCCELSFMSDISKQIGAYYVSREQIQNNRLDTSSRITHPELAVLLLRPLLVGSDVASDVFFNSKKSREGVIDPIAQFSGAITIGLNIEVSEDTAVSRITEWQKDGYRFADPFASPMHAYRTQSGRRSPIEYDEVDLLYELDGNLCTTVLTDLVLSRLDDDRLVN